MASDAPAGLRTWFVIHFAADMISALPLLVAPVAVLEAVGWEAVDPVAARLVAAALFGIGIESLLGRNADREAFVAMLNLKIIWSAAAVVGLAWSLAEGAHGRPLALWSVLGIFGTFNLVWVYWRVRLSR